MLGPVQTFWAIRISGYPDFSDNRIFGPQSLNLRARKLKLCKNHVGTYRMFWAIQISGYPYFLDNQIVGP